ncbi:hypothetical protein ATCC90586_006413 [Pythium insidiosum]|nr:hypothetical protein ATCC90586_006413 [Pythium insidiosum]
MKWPRPSTEGQSVRCDGDPNPNNVYRFTGGQLRLYPSPAIASSWDPSWNDAVTVDCSGVPRGPDMPNRSEWVTLPGKLNQIDFDGQAICGVNAADDIFSAVDNIRTRPGWRNIPGKLVQVVKCGNRLYGVNRGDGIWTGLATGDPQWRQLPGGLRQIECDGRRICGTNRGDDIWCADLNIEVNPNWRQVPGKLRQVLIHDDTFFGVNAQGQIWTAPFSFSPQWQQLPGEAAQISVNKGRMCGVLSNDDIFCSVNGWRYSIPGKLIGVSVGDEDLFGVNRNSDVFYRWIGRDTDRFTNCPNVDLDIANFVPELSDTQVQVLRLTVPTAFQNNGPTSVTLTADNGLLVSKRTLSFTQAATVQTVRVRVGTTPANGARLNLRVEWNSDRCGSRTRVLTYTVRRTPGCRGHSNGDPHMLSLDGVGFDFQRSGYFNLVQTRGLRVDIKMYKCGANLAFSCSDAVAIRNGESVVRFFIRNNVMLLSRATQELTDLSVFQAKGNPNSYRVFVLSDPSTYIDVSMGIYMNRGYFDVAAVLSPYMRADGTVTGLLGNGNGRPGDDLTAPDSLELLWTLSARENLIVASGDALTALLAPHNEDDDLALPAIPALEAAYNLLPTAIINFLPNIAGSLELVSMDENAAADAFVPQHLDEGKVRELCTSVINSIPHCKDVVGDASFYIENLCVRDTVAGGDISNIDAVKLSFLDECRRALNDKDILAGGQDAVADSELKELDLANPRECKDNCSGRGQCVTNGCHCNLGYTGWGCTVEVSVGALAAAVA